jgi:hypothetical protein
MIEGDLRLKIFVILYPHPQHLVASEEKVHDGTNVTVL